MTSRYDPSPSRMRKLAAALHDFREAYNAYLDVTWRHAAEGDPAEHRRRVNRAVPGAQHALYEVNMDPVVAPPPAVGGPVVQGLANAVFAHEEYGHGALAQTLLDFVDTASSEIESRRRDAVRRRLNPLYWVDRALRALLGLPVYLASLIFRVSLDRIEESPLALPLRLLGLVVEGLAAYFGGHAAHWW